MQLKTMRSEVAQRTKLGKYIGLRRTRAGLTQIEVSRKVGFSAQFYGKIEKGDVGCPLDSLVLLVPLLSLEKSVLRKIFVQGAESRVEELFGLAKKRAKI